MSESEAAVRMLAVIGTAGRDKTRTMDLPLWRAMCADIRGRVHSSDHLVSGGAAWADHLAVHSFLNGWCDGLRLFLPAPLVLVRGQWKFEEAGARSSGSAANWYHSRFSSAVGVDTLSQIALAHEQGATVECEPASSGFAGMFARNKKVARCCNAALAYTFNAGEEPADGGTMDTWKQVPPASRVHVDLGALQACVQQVIDTPSVATSRLVQRSQRYR